jgi:hypothetical protein
MHPYERWIIRRYLANALRLSQFVRPPSADSEIFPWVDTHSRLLGLPSWPSERCRQDGGCPVNRQCIPRIGRHGVTQPSVSLASRRPTLLLFKSALIGLRKRVRSTAVRAESSVFWRERRETQSSGVLSKPSATGSTWTVRSSSCFLRRTPSRSSSRPEPTLRARSDRGAREPALVTCCSSPSLPAPL